MATKRAAQAQPRNKQPGFKSTRKHPRAAINLLIDYQTLDQFFHDYATNISLGGVFIRSKNPLPVGTKLRVAFSLPGLEEMVETWGEVAHVSDERSQDGFTGMGVRFDDLSDGFKRQIDRLVTEGTRDAGKKGKRKPD